MKNIALIAAGWVILVLTLAGLAYITAHLTGALQ